MTYKETLDYLFSSLPAYQRIGKAAYKADLATTLALDKYFGSPHLHYKTVHIAGTNGKGSVSNFLASVLAEAGLRTGLYTSPHIRDFRERIRINGIKIEEEYIVRFIESHGHIFEKVSSSFFEMTAALAFQYFKDKEVDIAVIETGMGGRLDSTNIINPIMSVITNISLDHTQFLGSTKQDIAVEKAGIIKEGTPLVIGRSDPDTKEVFIAAARRSKSPIIFADNEIIVERIKESGHGRLSVRVFKGRHILFDKLDSGLAGVYQTENIATSIAALNILGKDIGLSDKHIEAGFRNVVSNTGIEGRWQIVNNKPLVICDTAHNGDGLSVVLRQLEEYPAIKLRFVLGFVNDKEIDSVLKLFPREAEYYLTKSSVLRSMKVSDLAGKATRAGLSHRSYSSVSDAYKAALIDSDPDDLIYVGGSTFIVADFLESCE